LDWASERGIPGEPFSDGYLAWKLESMFVDCMLYCATVAVLYTNIVLVDVVAVVAAAMRTSKLEACFRYILQPCVLAVVDPCDGAALLSDRI
jgi:hypothetical protein